MLDKDQEKKILEDKRMSKRYQVVFGSPEGKKVLGDILHRTCHVMEMSKVNQDHGDTAFREGERNVGLDILGRLNQIDVLERTEQLAKEALDLGMTH